jgi:membrane-associated phospholipid phosphatase
LCDACTAVSIRGVNKRGLLVPALAIALAVVLDRWVYDHVVYAGVYEKDWGRLLRVIGFLPLWIIAAFALWLQERDSEPRAKSRALLLLGSPALAGIVAELLKLLLRRERPEAHAGEYFFRSFGVRTFSTSGLALPSSHAMVAFGGAAMLGFLFPRTRWVWWSLAAGCAISRLMARAHFLTDVVVAAVAAFAVAALLWKKFGATSSEARRTGRRGPCGRCTPRPSP